VIKQTKREQAKDEQDRREQDAVIAELRATGARRMLAATREQIEEWRGVDGYDHWPPELIVEVESLAHATDAAERMLAISIIQMRGRAKRIIRTMEIYSQTRNVREVERMVEIELR
jgi:hypothetical protein